MFNVGSYQEAIFFNNYALWRSYVVQWFMDNDDVLTFEAHTDSK